jgi:hypothetical protein
MDIENLQGKQENQLRERHHWAIQNLRGIQQVKSNFNQFCKVIKLLKLYFHLPFSQYTIHCTLFSFCTYYLYCY